MEIKRNVKIAIYLIVFNLYRFYRTIMPLKKRDVKKLIAIQTPALEGNLVAVADELKKRKDVHLYWIAYSNKNFFNEMKNKGEEIYGDLDLSKIPLFYRTDVFIGTPGMGNIPTKYFKPGKWVDLWHGLPFKGFNTPSFINNINQFEITCVSSDWFKKTYSSWGIKNKKIKVTGYARTDKLVKRDTLKKNILEVLNMEENKKIVLYAPTWEQESEEEKKLFPWKENLLETLREIQKFCEEENVFFIIRPHKLWTNKEEKPLIEKIFNSNGNFNNILFVPFDKFYDTETLLFVSDVLITDWSSIANDYIILQRPIIFLDIPSPFRHNFTLSPEDRAGNIVLNKKEFFKILKRNLSSYKKPENYNKVVEKLYGKNFKYSDGKSAKRCVKEILNLIK
jgi:hypothetical protein